MNGHCSSWSAISSGDPQGSVLGPLLFIIFINDIDKAVDIVHCALLKFADDTKGVHIVNSKEDAIRLQLALDNLYEWLVKWQMLFNLDKCHILHFGSTNLCHAYNINGHMLASVEEEKDLGIYSSVNMRVSAQSSLDNCSLHLILEGHAWASIKGEVMKRMGMV